MNLQLKWISRGILLRLRNVFVKYMPNIHCSLGFLSQKILCILYYGLNKEQPLLICCGLKQRVRYYDLATCHAETTQSYSHSLRVYTAITGICWQIMRTPLIWTPLMLQTKIYNTIYIWQHIYDMLLHSLATFSKMSQFSGYRLWPTSSSCWVKPEVLFVCV